MIDYANEVFTTVANHVRSARPGVTFTGEYTRKPSKFPAATLDEVENVVVDALEDSSGEERYSGLSYRLQVFSNKKSGKKAEAREIFALADEAIRNLGFRRKTYATTPDVYESTIYSITATYEAVADVNGVLYKR